MNINLCWTGTWGCAFSSHRSGTFGFSWRCSEAWTLGIQCFGAIWWILFRLAASVKNLVCFCGMTERRTRRGQLISTSCLENPRDGEAWWPAVSGVAQSRTRLKRQQQQCPFEKRQQREHALSTTKRLCSLFGGLQQVWSAIAFWIPVKPLHLRSMLSKLMRDTQKSQWLQPALVNRKGPALLYDNAWPHAVQPVLQKLSELGHEVLPHLPYSPNLSPIN